MLDACVKHDTESRLLTRAAGEPFLLRDLAEDAATHRETQRYLWSLLGPAINR